ncbi:MAG: prepilin peptidase [Agathobacter sp.]|nr:prepilin peptidase [Agathobacter sp.]
METISYWILGIGYGSCAIVDYRRKTVPVWLLLSLFFMGFVLKILEGNLLRIELIYSTSLGISMVLVSNLTKEMIGYGDSLLLLVSGLFLNINELAVEFLIATTLCGIVSLILLLVFKKGRKYEISFIPFVFVAYIIMMCLKGN